MGKVDLFTIILDKDQPIYVPGEQIKGELRIKIKERLKINSVNLYVTGLGDVHWTETHNTGRNRYTITYSSHEDYLNLATTFVGKEGKSELYLEPGDYSYPFIIELPNSLPTSFEHTYGRIRYTVNGEIDIPWAIDKHVRKCVTVISPLDLNSNPALKQPSTFQDSKTICCWCCKSLPITAILSVPKGGYVAGEKLLFDAIIDNKSSSNIRTVAFRIVQNVQLRATSKTETFKRTIGEIYFTKQVLASSYEEWKGDFLVIPSVSATSNNISSIVNVYYEALLCVSPKGMALSLEVRIPITIGTIPFMKEGDRKNYLLNFERSSFEISDQKILEEKKKGEITDMDPNFVPYYPCLKA